MTIDAHRIASKLWMGGRPGIEACGPFDVIVLAAEEYQPDLPCKVIRAPLDDARPSREEVLRALRAARQVNRERRAGRRVLVSCWAGVNRSGLITALAMMLDGSTAENAISRIRQQRKAILRPLSNTHFVKLLYRLDPSAKAIDLQR